jgi:hypothetical protein
MFCNQCEQAAHGTGCTKIGVCGKSPDVSALQDLLVHASRSLAAVAVQAPAAELGRRQVRRGRPVHHLDQRRLRSRDDRREDRRPPSSCATRWLHALAWRVPMASRQATSEKIAQGAALGSPWDTTRDADVQSLQETTLYGLKGVPPTRTTRGRSARPTPRSTRTCSARLRRLRPLARPGGVGRPRARVRQGQPAHDGDPRRRQHRYLRSARADQGHLGSAHRQGDPDLGARSRRP